MDAYMNVGGPQRCLGFLSQSFLEKFKSISHLFHVIIQLQWEKLRAFHPDRLVLAPDPGSFISEGGSARWRDRELDPVKPAQ